MEQKLYSAPSCRGLLAALFLCMLPALAQSQTLQATAANTPAFTPQNLIENIFLGSGVEVSSITFNGDPVAVGYFTGGTNVIGIDRGIVMTTGRAQSQGATAVGCDQEGGDFANYTNAGGSTEPNLTAVLNGQALNDVAVFAITFKPTSDTLRFKYCFASEEYPEFACSSYNDVFGFFIEGPGYPTPTNIALIPNTTLPVTINNLHPQNLNYFPCPPTNVTYYNDNNNSNNQPSYDGFTDVFIAQAIVTPCQEYTIRLAIADVGDSAYDSGVFLEAKSFGTGSIQTEVATVSLDGTVSEGCTKGTITFTLPNPLTQDFPLDFNIWGTATNGTDYEPVALNQVIPAGQTQLVLDIVALEDLLPEGTETVMVDIKKNVCSRDTVMLVIRDNGLVPPMVRPDTSLCSGSQPLELDGTLDIPVPQPAVFTNSNTLSIPTFTATTSSIVVSGVQPIVLDSGVIRSVCINVNHNWVDDVDIFLISPGGQFIELTTDNGGSGDNYVNTCFTPAATTSISFPGPVAPSSAAPFTGDFLPEGVWGDLWGGPTNGQWQLQLVDDQGGINGTLVNWTITFEPSYKVQYEWFPATNLTCPFCPITNASPTTDTEYKIVATDSYGCKVTDSVTLTILPVLPAPAALCGNATNSTVTFTWPSIPTATGYEINLGSGWVPLNSDTAYTVSGLSPSTAVSADIRGIGQFVQCPALSTQLTCVNCTPPGVTAVTTPVSCFNATDGTATLVTDNQHPPYTFRVGTDSNNSGIFSNLPAGNYVSTVTDGLGCDTLFNFSIGTPAEITQSVNIQQTVSCFGGNDGALSVTSAGGVLPHTYLWSTGGATSSSVTNLSAATYTVTVTDDNGCTVTATQTITQPTQLTLTATATDAKCNGTATGSLTGTGTGGTSPYGYLWNTGATSAAVTNVQAGAYTLTITDSKGCTTTAQTTIAQPPLLTASAAQTPATCSNLSDGTATATATGGTGPYTYVWSDPLAQALPTATALSPQAYTVTISDANLCTVTATTTVTSPPQLLASVATTNVTCYNGNNGTATITATGGNGGYKYLWSVGAATTASLNTLAFGQYTVTVTDDKGCTTTVSAVINQPAALLTSTTSVNAKCFGALNGEAKVTVTGGQLPYNYLWSNGANTQSVSAIGAGIYTVTVTDVNNCTITATVTINQQPQIIPAFETANVLCYNGTSGTINTTVTGGTPPFNLVWYGPQNAIEFGYNIDSLAAGDYVVTITDNNSCTLVQTVTLYQPLAPLQLTIPYVSDTVCFNGATGVAKVFAQGGTTPYTYQWDDPAGQTAQFAANLPVNTYRVTVTDANGCTMRDSTFIYQKNPLFVYVTTQLPRCYNGNDGYASVDFVSYGVDPYDPNLFSYVWNTTPAQTGRLVLNLSHSTTYTVTATDEQGCTATQVAIVDNQEELTGYFSGVENVKCHGDRTGTAIANGAGGTAPYTYFWDPQVQPQTDPFAENLPAGTYNVTITDARTCQAEAQLVISEPPMLENRLEPTDVPCFGASTGIIAANVTGGTPDYEYEWSFGNVFDATLRNIPAGLYTVTVTDDNDCVRIDSVLIGQPANPVASENQITDVTCFGGNDGRVTLDVSGGTPPYQYALDNQPFNGSPIQIALKAGSYVPRILDGNGCITELPAIVVNQPNAVEIDLGPEIKIELGQNTQLTADVLNANPPVQITWAPSDSLWLSCLDCFNPFVDSLFQTQTFNVYAVDALGCKGENAITVVVEKPRKIYVPTGFTPNDDKNNDILVVHGQESAVILSFRVYDRWGEMVFQSNNFRPNQEAFGWDGNFRSKPMMPEVYVWVIEVEYLDGYKEVLHGQTTLIR